LSNTSGGNQALNSNTTGQGNEAIGQATLFSNTTGESNNAFGLNALFSNVDGAQNAAFGTRALFSNTNGGANSAFGHETLRLNTTGTYNSAVGWQALEVNTDGRANTAMGAFALTSVNNLGGNNIGIGYCSGCDLTGGSNNIDIGNIGLAGESNTIRIGTGQFGSGTPVCCQTQTYIAGIDGANVVGSAVMVDANGQLGVVSSSRRYKTDVQPMGDVSARLYQLRPVTFHYKAADARGEHPLQFGLVAEEVSEVLPELVVRNKDGQPESVAYHLLPAMLLSELQKQYRKELAQEQQLAAQARQLAEVNTQVDELRRQVRQLAERQQENSDGSVRAGVALPRLR
jgi:hypothetical protein